MPGYQAAAMAVTAAAVAVIVVLVLLVLWRRRTLLRTPGTFPARLRNGAGRSRSSRPATPVIARYDETTLELMTTVSVDPRPRWRATRHRLQLVRRGPGQQPGTVIIALTTGDETAELELAEGAAAGLSAWIESGPSTAYGDWRASQQLHRQRRAHRRRSRP